MKPTTPPANRGQFTISLRATCSVIEFTRRGHIIIDDLEMTLEAGLVQLGKMRGARS